MDNEVHDKEKKAGKLRRSCENCRNSKGRCLASEDGGRCQKCLKEGKECVFLEAKPRPKRARNSRTRVAEMEEKLEGLLNLLAAQTGATVAQTETSSNSNSTSTTPISPPSEPTRSQTDLPFFQRRTGTDTSFPNNYFPPTANQNYDIGNINNQFQLAPNGQPVKIHDVISKGWVNYFQAEEALSRFRKGCDSFPFVVVPEEMSVDALRRHRGFLLLGILCYGSASDNKLQEKLEREMREVLSRRLIVNGEKSLDLLEGLLVYITWYHHQFNPENQQIYQFCQMAISLTADLGIDRPTRRVGFGKVFTKGAAVHISAFLPNGELDDAESKRAYLGCYYISSSICIGLRKPTNLKYSTYMEECAQSLAHRGHAEHDHLLPYFIALQKICGEVNETFDYAANSDLPPIDAIRIGVLAKSFEQQLDQIESAFTPKAWNNAQLTMQLHFTRIYIYEIGFHAVALPQEEMLSPRLKSRSWYYSTQRSEILIKCLQASKDYIDRFLSLPSESLTNGTLPDIFGIVYAVLVLGTFAARIDTPTLDASQLREMTNYNQYLNALITKTSTNIPPTDRRGANDCIFPLHSLMQQTKLWYVQISADPSVTAVQSSDRAGPGFSFMDIITTVVTRCVDFASASLMDGVPFEEQQWNELLDGWSESLEPGTIYLGALDQFGS